MTVSLDTLLADPLLMPPPNWRELRVEVNQHKHFPHSFDPLRELRTKIEAAGYKLRLTTEPNSQSITLIITR